MPSKEELEELERMDAEERMEEEQGMSIDIPLEDVLAMLQGMAEEQEEAEAAYDEDMEVEISDEIKNALKNEAKEIKEFFSKMSEKIKQHDYSKCKEEDDFVLGVQDAIEEIDFDERDGKLLYLYRPFVCSYQLLYILQGVETDVEDIRYGFDTNTDGADKDYPVNYAKMLDDLTEETIYEELIGLAERLTRYGQTVFTKSSPLAIKKALDEYDNNFELEKTGDDGRTERIEKVSVGDKLTLKLDKYEEAEFFADISILASNKDGSIGYLPYTAAYAIGKAMNEGTAKLYAVVTEVTPLSKRSSRCKKGLCNVRIEIEE